MIDTESAEQRAIRLLTRSLSELQTTIRPLNYKHADFKAWHDSTASLLERFLGPSSHHTIRFRDTGFCGPMRIIPFGARRPPDDYVSREDMIAFRRGCETTEASLKAAIREIEDFGLYAEQPRKASPRKSGRGNGSGVTQNFHAPVTIHSQAIATDSAIQNIGQMGDQTVGASLREIAKLLLQSEELSPRQVREGLAHIETAAAEAAKPEDKRNWKSLLDSGKAILEITDKATDLATKLAPYTPAMITLVDQAKHLVK